jgi:hypothetical protein
MDPDTGDAIAPSPEHPERANQSRASLYLMSATIILVVFGLGGFLMWSGWQSTNTAAPSVSASSAAAPMPTASAQ